MNPIKQAKELVRSYTFPKGSLEKIESEGTYYDGERSIYFKEDEKVNNDIVANSLSYYIDISNEVVNEKKIKLGASKAKGLPHLPKSWEWPKGNYFYAQLNISDFKQYDLENLFPENGIIYLFDNTTDGFEILYYDGPLEELEVRAYPDKKTLPNAKYYWDDYVNETSILTFEPEFIFYLGGDAYDYRDACKLIPKDLKEQLEDILKAKLTEWSSSNRIFGRPLYWQGEDEDFEDDWDDEELDEDEFEDDEDFGDEESEKDKKVEENHEGREILIFHDEYGEGNIHVWINENDLKAKKFEKAHIGYSGT
jgi:uncharacterized protein YwqG